MNRSAPHAGGVAAVPVVTDYSASIALYARARKHLAGGVSTAFRIEERPIPLFIREAHGAHLVDVDGRVYVDYTCGFGPVVLGHGHPEVTAAVIAAAGKLHQVGGQHEGEVELAELLCHTVPSFEMVRLSSSGSEAVHAAVRLARGATGRPLIIKFAGHYHGWFDEMLTTRVHAGQAQPESLGQLPEALANIRVCGWNDVEAINRLFAEEGDRVAAVIMEAIACNQGVIYPAPAYLEHVRELTRRADALLIFDEVVTGFRVGLAGAQGLTGVTPDISVVAKAMANGYPISAFGGRRDLMDLVATNKVLHAGTFNGGGVPVAAALATIGTLQAAAPQVYERMAELGERLAVGLRAAATRYGFRLVVQGPGPVLFAWFLEAGEVRSYAEHLQADFVLYARFAELMLDAGVRVIPAGRWYLTAAHDEETIEQTLLAADHAFSRLARER